MSDRVIAPLDEGVGMELPGPRNSAHADPQWFELDTDDAIEDPDLAPFEPFPTPRHREIPS